MTQNVETNSLFPRVGKWKSGYSVEEVDEFLGRARIGFHSSDAGVITAADVRAQAFKYVKNGYEARFVDAALDRLEDVFAAREYRAYTPGDGVQDAGNYTLEYSRKLLSMGNELQGRTSRPAKSRFRKRLKFAKGYKRSQVDLFLSSVADAINGAGVMTAQSVREITFDAEWGGYDEAQVDAYLDVLVEFLLAGSVQTQ